MTGASGPKLPCVGSPANAGVSSSLAAPAGVADEIVLGEEDIHFPIKNPFGASSLALAAAMGLDCEHEPGYEGCA